MLALESTDLPPGWNVNEITADPHSSPPMTRARPPSMSAAATRPRASGRTTPSPHEKEGERVRVRLIPYHQWANRGPATMRTWLPVSARRSLP